MIFDPFEKFRGVAGATVPSATIVVDPTQLKQQIALAVAAQVRENLARGLAPDGVPLPALSPATIRRRQYRAEQAARGGAPDERFTDEAFRARAEANYRERFPPGKAPAGGVRPGVESGTLLSGIKAEGGAVTAPARGHLRTLGLWSAAAQRQPQFRRRLQAIARSLIRK